MRRAQPRKRPKRGESAREIEGDGPEVQKSSSLSSNEESVRFTKLDGLEQRKQPGPKIPEKMSCPYFMNGRSF
jgi:hypothetical protein